MKRIALIPAYEPGSVLNELVWDLVGEEFEVIIVNDGSGSEYDPVFEKLRDRAVVISYPTNHGKGYALKNGLEYILKREPKAVIVTVDADGQHLASDAAKLCSELEYSHNVDMVIGSRIISKDAPVKSRYGNGITRQVYRLVTGVKVYDTQSGLRAFRSDLIPLMLTIPGDRYEYEMNVLLFMARNRKCMKEVPIKTIYFDKQNSISHFDSVRDSIKIYREILRYAGSSFLGFLVDYLIYILILMAAGTDCFLAANIGARVISSSVNFMVNRTFVFRSQGNIRYEAVKYFSLVIFSLAVNSVLLTLFTTLGMNAYPAKIVVECLMFFFNYAIQCCLVFRKEQEI